MLSVIVWVGDSTWRVCSLSRQLFWSLSCSATWTLSQCPAVQSWCPASLIRPPDLHSGASGAGCHSLQRTRRWSTPEGSWASLKTPWLLLKTDSVGVRIRFKLTPILSQLTKLISGSSQLEVTYNYRKTNSCDGKLEEQTVGDRLCSKLTWTKVCRVRLSQYHNLDTRGVITYRSISICWPDHLIALMQSENIDWYHPARGFMGP